MVEETFFGREVRELNLEKTIVKDKIIAHVITGQAELPVEDVDLDVALAALRALSPVVVALQTLPSNQMTEEIGQVLDRADELLDTLGLDIP